MSSETENVGPVILEILSTTIVVSKIQPMKNSLLYKLRVVVHAKRTAQGDVMLCMSIEHAYRPPSHHLMAREEIFQPLSIVRHPYK